jgi:hypothetical protein
MRLEALYRARFTTRQRWSVELRGPHGSEGQSLLFAEGRCEGRLQASLQAVNFPRRRADGTLTPDFRGVLEVDDGATILFSWHGYGLTGADGARRLVGTMTHLAEDEHHRWLNDVICAVAGSVEPRADGHGLDVVIEVSQLVWEPPAAGG